MVISFDFPVAIVFRQRLTNFQSLPRNIGSPINTVLKRTKGSSMLQSALIGIIEQTAPLSLMAEWDHSGVQVACAREHIHHLAVCLDPVPVQIRQAVSAGADMVLTHPPLTLHPAWTDVAG